jgi:hypothetical protein
MTSPPRQTDRQSPRHRIEADIDEILVFMLPFSEKTARRRPASPRRRTANSAVDPASAGGNHNEVELDWAKAEHDGQRLRRLLIARDAMSTKNMRLSGTDPFRLIEDK